MSVTRPSSPYTTTPKFSGSGTCATKICAPRAASAHPTIAERVDHLPRVALAGHEQHVPDASELEQLERVVDHRPAADRQQVLVRDARQLPETRRLPAGADQALRGPA